MQLDFIFIDPVALDTHVAVKMFVTYFLNNVAFQTFLANEDLGDSIDEVEVLMKKHDDFEKSLNAQEEKIKVEKHTVKRFIYDRCVLVKMECMMWIWKSILAIRYNLLLCNCARPFCVNLNILRQVLADLNQADLDFFFFFFR